MGGQIFLRAHYFETPCRVSIITRELDPFQGNGSFYFVLREIQTMIYIKKSFFFYKIELKIEF